MGNCCSFKRGHGDELETSEDAQKILEGLTSSSLHHHHHHSHHHHSHHHGTSTKRHSATILAEMKPLHHSHHHHHHNIINSSSGGSGTTTITSQADNKRHSLKNKITISKEDLHNLSVGGGDDYPGCPGSQNSTTSLSILNGSTTNNSSISNNSSQSSISFKLDSLDEAQTQQQLQQQPHYYPKSAGAPYSHTRQLSTEKVGGSFGPQFKTPLTSIPQHMRMEGFQRAKHNSTSSLYIKSTLSTPDNDEILRCMACALLYHIEKGIHAPQKTFDIFSEEKYPITKSKIEIKSIPTVDIIYKFVRDIFKAERLDSECAIMCLAYVERIIALSAITIGPSSWRRIVLSSLILASKVWEDQSVWNVDFLPVFDNLTATDLNNLERQFLSLIQYNVSLTASVYAKYYFELRTFSKLDSNHFPLKPLDKVGAKRLEDHSQASESRVKTFKRSASVDQINPPELHTRAVLN